MTPRPIVAVLHDADLTGAPKVGLELALQLAARREVHLVVKRGGPLLRDPRCAAFASVTDAASHHEILRAGFRERVELARAVLEPLRPGLVYVASAAAAEYVLAAEAAGAASVLHVQELDGGISALEGAGAFSPKAVQRATLVIAVSPAAADAARAQAPDRPGVVLSKAFVDVAAARRAAEAAEAPPRSAAGEPLSYRRPVVCMCGTASPRKGADLFVAAAAEAPEWDFVWVGPWEEAVAGAPPPAAPNVFLTGVTANPAAHLKRATLFALTSREDPNPLVVMEALSLGVPTLSFTEGVGSHALTSRFGTALSGPASAERLAGFLRRAAELDLPRMDPGLAARAAAEVDGREELARLTGLILQQAPG